MDAPDPEQLFASCATSLLPAGDPLLLAVSGGSDSMALLAAAVRWDRTRVAVVHVHHGLRQSADGDARLVREVSGQLALPCEIVHAPPAQQNDTPATGQTETAARERRMDALSTVANRRGVAWVATAHHREDALETLLLHLWRGHRGDRALASIPTVRNLDTRTRLLRPFLYAGPLVGSARPVKQAASVGRRELEAYRTRIGLPHREDPTNRDLTIPRNAIRRVLGAAQPPLDPDTLDRIRRAARRRLEQRLVLVASTLESAWRPEGRGCLVGREAWQPPPGESMQAWVPEVLRVVGAGLSHPRVVAPRASVTREVSRLLQRGTGTLVVPAKPAPFTLRASRVGVHLLDERLPEGCAASRILSALSRTSLYV